MENSNKETTQRLWNHCFGNNSRMSDYSKIEAARMLEEAGIFTPNDPNSPEIVVWYRANRSISTADLNVMLDDLKKEGKECCILVVDYLRRIRAAEPNKDLRLELANVTNELKTIATEQDIPVITASQLNREAFRMLDEAETFDEKIRQSDKIGASAVGESIDIIQNADYSFVVNKMFNAVRNEAGDIEYTDNFLLVKLIASRGRQSNIVSFKHRFEGNNDMKLIEDIYTKPVSVVTTNDMVNDRVAKNGQKTRGPRSIATS